MVLNDKLLLSQEVVRCSTENIFSESLYQGILHKTLVITQRMISVRSAIIQEKSEQTYETLSRNIKESVG